MGTVAVLLVGSTFATRDAWAWIGVQLLLAVVIPLAYVGWLVRRGQVSDYELYVREQRHRPYVATLIGMTLAVVVLYAGHAPHLLVVLAIASLVQTLLLFGVNRRWKISTHSAAAAAVAVLGYTVVGATAASPLAAAVPVVGWSRVRLGRHDRGQIVAGALVGGLVWALALRWA
jgi:membrane-associated phospholipid phosphatase